MVRAELDGMLRARLIDGLLEQRRAVLKRLYALREPPGLFHAHQKQLCAQMAELEQRLEALGAARNVDRSFLLVRPRILGKRAELIVCDEAGK